jgi:hypothetical protein
VTNPGAALAKELAQIERRRAEIQAQAVRLRKPKTSRSGGEPKPSSGRPRKKSPAIRVDSGSELADRGTRGTGDVRDKGDEGENEVQVVEKAKGRRSTKPSMKVRENLADEKVAKEARVRKNTHQKAKQNQQEKTAAARAALNNIRARRVPN